MVGGNNGQDGFSSVPFARQKIVVQPPTIFCRILYLPVEPQTAPRKDPPAPVSDVAAATREKSAEDQALRASHTGSDAPAPVPAPAPPPSRGTLSPIHPLSA
jgi:hypothetical protein